MRAHVSTRRYSSVAIILHWVMALGIAVLVVMGLVMTHLKLDPMRLFQLYQLHKSIGIIVLLAAFLRLLWRLTVSFQEVVHSVLPSESEASATSVSSVRAEWTTS